MNTNLIPYLPFKFKSLAGFVWTVTESTVNRDGYGEYFAVRNEDGREATIPSVKMKVNLKSGYWEIVKEEKPETTKDKLASIINNEGQCALDYLKEKYMNEMPKLVAGKHWVVVENEGYGGIGLITINNMIQYMKNEDGAVSNGFDSAEDVSRYIVEVREIADDTPPTFKSAKIVWKKVDQKQLAIQKELEFAKAKAERLAAHISVLESKLK